MESTEGYGGSKKVFIVGLDGGTYDLVRPWVEQGYLPNFRRLMAEGLSKELTVELPPGTVPNWPSFMTGKNAGKHGVLYWFTHKEDFSQLSIVNSQSIKEKTLWEIVASHGKKFISINVPVTYPPKPIDGLMITGLLTPPSAKTFTWPPELQDEINSAVGRYKVYPDEIYREGKEGKFLDSLMETLDIRFRTSRYLMSRYDWDLFMIVFSETDAIQHSFWKLIDPAHPKYDATLARQYGKGVLQVYQKIDEFLGSYLETLEKGTTLILMSDHGAGPLYRKFYTNNWLRSLGLLTIKRSPWPQLKYWAFRCGFTMQNLYRFLLKIGMVNWRRKVDKRDSTESMLRRLFLSYRDIDWDRTQAFAFGGLGQIYLNVKGDLSGVRYENAREAMMRRLREMEGPDGSPFIERLYKREDLYNGPNCSTLPDLIFMPKPGYLDPGDFEFFSNRILDDTVGISGSHRDKGIFLIRGALVKPDAVLKEVRIHDLAPTTLYLMGLPIPADMDGRVLVETLKEEWVEKHPIQLTASGEEAREQELGYSRDEEEEIKKRLKGLGYLG